MSTGAVHLTSVLAILCAAAAAALWFPPPHASARVRQLTRVAGGRTVSPRRASARLRRAGASLAFAVAVWAVVGGWTGLLAGAVAAALAPRLLGRLVTNADEKINAELTSTLPLAACLIGACLRAGRPVADSVAAVGATMPGPLGERLAEVAAGLSMGADPAQAWLPLTRHPATARAGRTLVRALESGAPAAEAMDALADNARTAARAHALQRARAIGVQATLPLGLCFLPAFVAVGLVPVIASVIGSMITSLR
jgi:pilus assembly protein TadC